MATVAVIQNDLDSLSATLLDLGMSRPDVEFRIRNQRSFYITVNYYDEHEIYKHLGHFADTAVDAISHMQNTINQIPPKEDRERSEYLRRIASAIEYGKKIGIDETFINPLELQMKKLSSNIIEYTAYGSSAVGRTAPVKDFNDEVPF